MSAWLAYLAGVFTLPLAAVLAYVLDAANTWRRHHLFAFGVIRNPKMVHRFTTWDEGTKAFAVRLPFNRFVMFNVRPLRWMQTKFFR